MSKKKNENIKREIDCIKCIISDDSIFSTLTLPQKEKVIENHICSFYYKNSIIYKEGDNPIGLICLVEGKVKLHKEGINNKEQIVRLVNENGFIGYRALFAREKYNSTAATLEDSVICTIEKDLVFEIMRENHNFTLEIIRRLATELGFSTTRSVSLTQKHIRGRLADALLFLKKTYGIDEENNINVLLARDDLANLANMTTSNAIRTLSNFVEEGVIKVDGKKIKILDLSRLRKISEIG